MSNPRGADVLANALKAGGVRRIFSLSGNHIMPLYDALFDSGIDIVHVRHEGAAVHMADAWARLTGEVGIALLTGGPGHANGVSALYTALASESPVVLLSGHAPQDELGLNAFQEMRQADLAAPVTKASWTATQAASVGGDLARAMRVAAAGRPGPVHLSLPTDVLETRVEAAAVPALAGDAFRAPPATLSPAAAAAVLAEAGAAARPVILAGPAMASRSHRGALAALADASGIPAVVMESPRGVNDPCLGAIAEVLAQADLVILLGKQTDFTLKFGRAPAFAANCRFVQIDPEPEALSRAQRAVGPARLSMSVLADTRPAMEALTRAAQRPVAQAAWRAEVDAAVAHRPAAWNALKARPDGPLHPVELCRSVRGILEAHPDAVLVSDGGEFGQWAQACLAAPHRVVNGPAGAIGSAIPFALAARMAVPHAPVVALLGDGTFGFHMAEFDTAVRHRLPFVAVVGNDACWNAEHQIQLRSYGADRAHSCELLPARYDAAVTGLGGHGEWVTRGADLAPALERALASGLPACVNVQIERQPAPSIRR